MNPSPRSTSPRAADSSRNPGLGARRLLQSCELVQMRLLWLQDEPFIPRLAAANYLERPLTCGSRAPQTGGRIPPQGH